MYSKFTSSVIGTRGSALALAQTTLVQNLLKEKSPELVLEQKIISTVGDANPSMPLHQPTAEASGLFTKQLEEALLAHEIDLAVHSLKDLPVCTPPGLKLAAILPRAVTTDLLITLQPGGIEGLPVGAVVGSSSPRRVALLNEHRSDFSFTTVRGNVPTRLRKLAMNQSEYPLDALVLARAGLERLGYNLQLNESEGSFVFDETTLYVTELTWMLPAPGQGAIAVETRENECVSSLGIALATLHDPLTACCVAAERFLLQYLGGGCHMALGALATVDEVSQEIHLRGIYVPTAGGASRTGEAKASTPEEVALLVALQLGAKLV